MHMGFTFSNDNIRGNQVVFIYEECSFPGVRRVAGWVRDDIEKIFGAKPIGVEYADFNDTAAFYSYPVFFGTVGRSAILDELSASGKIDLFGIAAEREVYSFKIVNGLSFRGFTFSSALIIAGSDKRGTIYGLLKLSEILGVSPFLNWLGIRPAPRKEFTLLTEDSFVSNTPSVKYRGFFINNERPAFYTWCNRNFGGFNAKMYGRLFELLLRLKGNYMWPAMETSVFYEDGPGYLSADLADELGVVIGTSYNEPCLRHAGEYGHVRGKDLPYGDVRDFISNREGLVKFWADGISERCKYENIITVGMCGDDEHVMLSKDASFSDNIGLLREVIAAQNDIIADTTGKNMEDVPRMFAVSSSTGSLYYGDDKTKGLKDDPALDGVTILFSDDNYGNLANVPAKEERSHKGGFGMYYHLDYHGLPVSYEWFNTSYLPGIWEQMTTAYDNGIRQIWIVNVGDLFTNEYPLAFFLDLAYDYDRWGASDKDSAKNYTQMLVSRSFPTFSEDDKKETARLLLGYTKITSRRRSEAANSLVYAPFAFGESDMLLGEIRDLCDSAERIYKGIEDDTAFVFYELVYLPLNATLNIQKMWAFTGKNHAYAAMGSTVANSLAKQIKECIKTDRKIVEKLDAIHKGRWYGMGRGEHIGYTRWCAEECRYPIVHTLEGANTPRLIVCIPVTGEYTEGGCRSGRILTLPDALDPVVCGGFIELSTASEKKVPVEIKVHDDFLDVTKAPGNVKCGRAERVFIFVDRMKIPEGVEYTVGHVSVTAGDQKIRISVPVYSPGSCEDAADNTFLYCGDPSSPYMNHISMGAAHFAEKNDTGAGSFEIIEGYGRAGAAIKAFPQDRTFDTKNAPSVTYRFILKNAGNYTVRIYTSPANPPHESGNISFGMSVNGKDMMTIDMIPDGYRTGDGNAMWSMGVLNNVHIKDTPVRFDAGLCSLTIFALSPLFVLEKIVIFPEGAEPAYSYLGPSETYRITQ